jgi:hypothetical protein
MFIIYLILFSKVNLVIPYEDKKDGLRKKCSLKYHKHLCKMREKLLLGTDHKIKGVFFAVYFQLFNDFKNKMLTTNGKLYNYLIG